MASNFWMKSVVSFIYDLMNNVVGGVRKLSTNCDIFSVGQPLADTMGLPAKQTASGLLFNTWVRAHGETEREYAVALQQLALYAYKDLTQSHIESRCNEQFLAGLRFRELRSHLGLFCCRSATVQDLVSCAEAYRASRTETDLISDDEEAAVTIAYARGSQPDASFTQWTKTVADKKPEVSTSAGDDRAPGAPARSKQPPRYSQKVSTKIC